MLALAVTSSSHADLPAGMGAKGSASGTSLAGVAYSVCTGVPCLLQRVQLPNAPQALQEEIVT